MRSAFFLPPLTDRSCFSIHEQHHATTTTANMDPKLEFINVYQKRLRFFCSVVVITPNQAERNQKRPNQKSKVDPLELLPDSVVLCRPISKNSESSALVCA